MLEAKLVDGRASACGSRGLLASTRLVMRWRRWAGALKASCVVSGFRGRVTGRVTGCKWGESSDPEEATCRTARDVPVYGAVGNAITRARDKMHHSERRSHARQASLCCVLCSGRCRFCYCCFCHCLCCCCCCRKRCLVLLLRTTRTPHQVRF
ncbi:LAQU0S06e02190g1_1 [Lachancea quebecensis]|uniref:LAQU0S06e02190g1_1 n=1 Tax=Lachancea quebecensis TaxID=1654605 RepID=A0A0P1KR63_9SACH|nr:LAQU0S06e02190g1_1 [Lachancea quebecensis]